MNKLKIALRSRTVWTVVVLFLINGVAGIRELLPPESLFAIDAFLSFLAVYFRLNRRAD